MHSDFFQTAEMEILLLLATLMLGHVTSSVAHMTTEGNYMISVGRHILSDPQGMGHLHSVHPRAVGSCQTEQLGEIFEDITESCGEALLTVTTVQSLETPEGFSALKSLCKRRCGRILTTFTDTCGFPFLGQRFRTVCASNDEDLCLSLSQENNGSLILALCGLTPTVSCSAECRDALEEFRSNLGCCVQTLFNSSVFGLDLLPIASHQLWSVCGVESVELCADPFGGGTAHTGTILLIEVLLIGTLALM